MRVVAAVLAAGQGSRFGGDKILERLGQKPVWRWSYDALSSHPAIERVFVVASIANQGSISLEAETILGGASRQESVLNALSACEQDDLLLIHDGARPFLSGSLIDRLIEVGRSHGAAAPGVPVADTIREVDGEARRIVERSKLVAMQTPQVVRVGLLREAYESCLEQVTDDMAVLEALGADWVLVDGDAGNFKITTQEDMERARAMVGTETRTGLGYDVHRFSEDDQRRMFLGGVEFEGPGLEGHSDADVLIHAAVDALLGAAALGDIGQHFPNTDPRWSGEPSSTFLKHAAGLVRGDGWSVVHLDIAVIAERPKIMPKAPEIRARIAECLGIEVTRVSVKATTHEGLGSLGRGEGIAAFATATLARGCS